MKIRLWKLGNLEHKITPSKESIEKFQELLKDITEDGVKDIVWGPDIQCEIISTDDPASSILKYAEKLQPIK